MVRKRLTITLDPQILKRADSYVDGEKIRNRSHAIEYLIKKSFPLKVDQAVILAGGPGVNFRPLTYEIPTVLIPFKGKPLLVHIIDQIKQAGIHEVVLCVGHLSEKVVETFGDGQGLGVEIKYSFDGPRPIGTAGALLGARKLLRKSPFMVFHGDVLSNIDLVDMINFHEGDRYLATIALTTVKEPRHYGIVRVRGKDVIEYKEKPPASSASSHLVHAGIYVLEPQVFEHFPKKKSMMMEKDIFPSLAKAGKMAGYLLEGKWFDVSYPKSYEKALRNFKFS